MKIAIWGSYAYGNYGDELMAIVYAVHLRKLGASPIVFCLHAGLAEKYGVETTASIEDLLKDSAFCVFGGGSLLSPNKAGPKWYQAMKKKEYEMLLEGLRSHDCPIYYFSIGGDGPFSAANAIADYRKKLLVCEQSTEATVRQEEDVSKLQEIKSMPVSYYPDVLFYTGEFFGIARGGHADGHVHVGINLPSSYKWVMSLCRMAALLRKDIIFHFFSTVRDRQLENNFSKDLGYGARGRRLYFHKYDDPEDLLNALSKLDLLVGNKLHIGLTAILLGAPYLCIAKSLKAKAFLHGIGAEKSYLGDLSRWKLAMSLLRIITCGNVRKKWVSESYSKDLKPIIEQSKGHLDVLEAVFRRHSA